MSCPKICLLFHQWGGPVPLPLNIYHRVSVTVTQVLSKPVKVTVKVYPRPSGDVSPYFLIRMSKTNHLYLCSILPRDSDYVIVGTHEVHHLDARGGKHHTVLWAS